MQRMHDSACNTTSTYRAKIVVKGRKLAAVLQVSGLCKDASEQLADEWNLRQAKAEMNT